MVTSGGADKDFFFFFLSTVAEANGVPSQCSFVGFPSLWKWLNYSGDGDQEKPQWREKEKSQISFSLSKKSDRRITILLRGKKLTVPSVILGSRNLEVRIMSHIS